ncbi:MAG: deoxyribose-phosphate aldolase [Candidatus Bipolaricaulota bacterium]|nr:deoxyribose-phosphate aldolase [Candidatus Bipolaricaulota bacterium]
MKKSDLAALIDHTTLGPQSTEEDVERVCREAKEYGFASVCVEPIYVSTAAELLKDTEVKVDTVIGFPHGTHKRGAKGFEAQLAIEDGADELDTVVNVPALQSGDYQEVSRDIYAVTEAAEASARTVLVKVILEMGLLEEETKRAGCVIAQASGADFVKTSTGFGPSGATVEDVELMSSLVSDEVGVKAAGGIGDFEAAREMIEAGATRIGASSGVEIVEGAPEG